jgi:hypothetical protein
MPFCQNESCGKTGLRPQDVEFDEEVKKVVCKDCYRVAHNVIEVVTVPVQELAASPFRFGVHVTTEDGVKAEVQYQKILVQAHVPTDEIKRILGI